MRRPPRDIIAILIAGAIWLVLPGAALAGGGGSAGDQQYTDPFAGSSTPTTTQPATPTPAATPAPVGSTPAASPAASTTPASSAAATSAPGAAATDPSVRPRQLAFTGYDSWTAGGFGLVMVGGGLILRRRAGRAGRA